MLKVKVQAEFPGDPPQMLLIDRACVTVEVTAQMLSLGRTAIYELIDSGELASFKYGRRRLVPVKGIYEFVDRRMQAAS